MAWATDALELENDKVKIRTYGDTEVESITDALKNDPHAWNSLYWGWSEPETIAKNLRALIEAHGKNQCNPLVYHVGGEVAGITRYMRIDPLHRVLEIGGTAVAPKWRRTFVNTHVKYLLLQHAFESLNGERVEFRVNVLNYISQLNVLRIGATFEGKMRSRQIYPDSEARDGLLYSIVKSEWPAVKAGLEARMRGESPAAPFLESRGETARLKLRLYRLADAEDLFSVVQRNRKDLVEGFPQSGNLRDVEETRGYIADKAHLAAKGEAFFYGIWHGQSNRLIGQVQLKAIDWKTRSAEVGYFLDEESRRQGYTREALHWALNELLEKRAFRRVFARVQPQNVASARLVQSVGFEREGVMRNAFVTGSGEVTDIALYSLVK